MQRLLPLLLLIAAWFLFPVYARAVLNSEASLPYLAMDSPDLDSKSLDTMTYTKTYNIFDDVNLANDFKQARPKAEPQNLLTNWSFDNYSYQKLNETASNLKYINPSG